MGRKEIWLNEARIISEVITSAPFVDISRRISADEFARRQQALIFELDKIGIKAAIVYSDEHYY